MEQHHPTPGGGSSEAAPERARDKRRYLPVLVTLLMSVTIFEGYDVTIFHLCTPDIVHNFHLSDLDFGAVASLVRLGGMAAFVVVMLADRYGRKPLVSFTVLLYTLFTLFTALSSGLRSFTLFQASAQLFLSAEFSLATIMISEEFPDRWRGRGVAMLNMTGLIGVEAASFLYAPVAGSSWGWRGMYFIGIGPLLLVAFLRRNLRETDRFTELADRGSASLSLANGLRRRAVDAFRLLGGPYRGRLLMVALLWNSVGIVSSPAVTFFTLYARRDRRWSRGEIGRAIALSYAIGMSAHVFTGYMLDRVGRKLTTCASYILGAVAILFLFQSSGHAAMVAAMIVTVFAFQGARTATATYSAELFPTEIRATSYSLTVQVLGQFATLLTPITIGALSHALGGLGNAVAVVSIGPLIGALIVGIFAPETRGMRLEEAGLPESQPQ
jgi:MFS transporter, putative metabolite:H+ symporter